MAKIFYDQDCDLAALDGQTVAVIGYGNQGRSQALNLRDSGINVIVGNPRDSYHSVADKDGMKVYFPKEAVQKADVIMMEIPDEIQGEVFDSFRDELKPGALIIFAHGYNIFYKLLEPLPEEIDIGLVAPRMIGEGVRICYQEGFASVVAVEKDFSGTAWPRTLAIARGIGGTRKGAWKTTFEEETIIDLFGEQSGGGAQLRSTIFAYETLVEAGYNPEIVLLELYASGEIVEVFKGIQRYGLLESLKMHSPTSQYGQMSRSKMLVPDAAKETLKKLLDDLQNGNFEKEWANERKSGYRHMEELREKFAAHQMFKTEKDVRKALHKEE